MLTKRQITAATTRAAEVLREFGAKARIEQEGYTRVDPFRIADSAGVLVMLRPLEKLLGAFLSDVQPGILVNSERPAGLIQMTCAHELGHYFLKHGTTSDEQLDYSNAASQKELEADWFAYGLVAPRWAIARIMKRKGWTVSHLSHPFVLYQLALRLGISYKATAWSLNRLELMPRQVVQEVLNVQPAAIKKSLLQKHLLINSQRDVWLLDDADRDLILEPRVDDKMIIRLKNHSGSGYVWTTGDASSEGFSIEPVTLTAKSEDEDTLFIAGGAQLQDYLVTHVPELQFSPTHLELAERQPWRRSAPSLDQFSTSAQFELIAPGLSQAAKEKMLQGSARS